MTEASPPKRRQLITFDPDCHALIAAYARADRRSFNAAVNILCRLALRVLDERNAQGGVADWPLGTATRGVGINVVSPIPAERHYTDAELAEMTKPALSKLIEAHPSWIGSRKPLMRWHHSDLVDLAIQLHHQQPIRKG